MIKEEPRRIALAITGASGVQYAFRLLECLLQAGVRVHLMISKPGQVVVGMDTDWTSLFTQEIPGRSGSLGRLWTRPLDGASGQWLGCTGGDGGMSLYHGYACCNGSGQLQ